MNGYQIGYTLALVALTLPAWHRQRYVLGWLWFNLVAILAICLAMDLGMFGATEQENRDGATVSMLIVDLGTGVGLALRPGLPSLIALGYAITVPIYFVNLVWAAPIDTTWGFIYIAATAQMGALAIGVGPGFGSGGGGRRRPFADRVPVARSTGNGAPAGALVSCGDGSDQVPQ